MPAMDWFGEYVFVPMWSLFLLMALATGAAQYLLIGMVKVVNAWYRHREDRKHSVAHPSESVIVLPHRKDRTG